ASGTGNMKFIMNGAVTIGTLDGANIEIEQEVGAENFFQFGLSISEVQALARSGYDPLEYYEQDAELRAVIDLIRTGFFSRGDASLFAPLTDELLSEDRYMLCADYRDYVACQERVDEAYGDTRRWARMSILKDRKSTRLNSSHVKSSYAVFCLKKKI